MSNKSRPDDPPSYNEIAPSTPLQIPPQPSYNMGSTPAKGVPPELQHLLQVNQVCVSERYTAQQGWGRSFEVQDHNDQRIYQANQQLRCCMGIYNLKIQDGGSQDVMEVNTNTSCCCRCYDEIEVTIPSLGLIGTVTYPLNRLNTTLSILNPQKEVVLVVLGPGTHTSLFGNCTFEVKSRDEQHVVGMIKSEGNRFIGTFPLDLEVTMKAMLLACCFYLEFVIFNKRRNLVNRPRSDSH